jgi:DNA-binding MarR family transcriptional regulator
MTTPASPLLTLGLALLADGVSVIPIDHTSKRPHFDLLPQICAWPRETDREGRLDAGRGKGSWEAFKHTHATPDELRGWIAKGAQALAAITGEISGGLEVLDFDVIETTGEWLYPEWAEDANDLAYGLPSQATGGGGRQIAYRYPLRNGQTRDGNLKLAYLPDVGARRGESVAIETRGEGGYFVLPHSLHPSGKLYRTNTGDWTQIPTISAARRDSLLTAARRLDQSKEYAPQPAQRPAKETTYRHSLNGQASVIDVFNAAHSIESQLEAAGYLPRGRRYYHPQGGDPKRPGVVVLDGKSYHHDSDDPLSDGYAHSAFDVFCQMSHDGDVKAAVKDAAKVLGVAYAPHTPRATDASASQTVQVPKAPQNEPAPQAPAMQRYGSLVHASRIGEVVPKIQWLIPGVLGLNSISQLFGAGGSGKSLLALDQALCVAQRAPVIYVAGEAAGEQEERVRAWCAHHKRDVGDLYFWPHPVTLKDPIAVDAFIEEVLTVRPALIVLDPLASCMVGLEESSTGDMTIAVDALNRIRSATGAAINVVHHTGWNEAHERGNSALRAACRVVVKLSTDDTGLMTLTSEKANNGKPFDARYFRLIESADSVAPIPASKATTKNAALTVKHIAILEALALRQHTDGASFTQVLDYTEQGKSTLHKGINRLLERGLIVRNKQSYQLTDAGRRELLAASTATEFASSPNHAIGELGVNWLVEWSAERVAETHQEAEFTDSSPVVRLEFAHDGELSEQSVNWEPETTHENADIARPDAEFTEFTADPQIVHPDSPESAGFEFTEDSASECDSSPQFTASSLTSSPPEFTSSPPLRSLERRRGELTNQEQPPSPDDEPADDEPLDILTQLRRGLSASVREQE